MVGPETRRVRVPAVMPNKFILSFDFIFNLGGRLDRNQRRKKCVWLSANNLVVPSNVSMQKAGL